MPAPEVTRASLEDRMRALNTLPIEEQTRIKGWLRAYDEVVVFFENGRYQYGVCLKNHYAPDHEYIGTYKADEVYSKDERIENYINEFHSYPPSYKGKRDYALMHKMDDERVHDWDTDEVTEWRGKLINGDFALTERVTYRV